jgi:outer membrane protein insertion porin family
MFMAQVSQQNLFGRGQTLALKASFSSMVTQYELSFVEPWLFDIPLWSKLDLWNSATVYDTYSVASSGFGTTVGYPLWQKVTGYLGYRLSMDDVNNIADTASATIKAQEGKTTLSSLSATLTRDTTDDYMFPSLGSRSSGTFTYTGGLLQGTASYNKYEASSSQFFPLPFDTVFGIRERGGFLQKTGDAAIPIYQRFYLGGINSLRGLRYVGPTDPVTGDVIGGTTMLNFNAEYLFPLIKNAGMKGVIFFDTGNAWESGYHLDDLRKTTGVGVRWYSPIGPLRLEWGYVLDPRNDEPSSRWEFSMGMFM